MTTTADDPSANGAAAPTATTSAEETQPPLINHKANSETSSSDTTAPSTTASVTEASSTQPPSSTQTSSSQSDSQSQSSSSADREDDEPARKKARKKRALWDQTTPVPPPATATTTSPPAPAPINMLPAGSIPTFAPSLNPVINPLFAQMQAQLPALGLSSTHALSNAATASRLDRRIYVGSLSYEISEETIKTIFSPFGVVAKVDMPKEGARSKGFCFVEFEHPDSAKAALMTMNQIPINGRPMKVGKPTGASDSTTSFLLSSMLQSGSWNALAGQTAHPTTLAAIQAAQLAAGNANTQQPSSFIPQTNGYQPTQQALLNQPATVPIQLTSPLNQSSLMRRIYVGSLYWDLTDDQVRSVFEPFGTIRSCQLQINPETGKHRGYGFIEYEDDKSAEDAIKAMDGQDLCGRKLKVNYASALNSQGGGAAAAAPPFSFPSLAVNNPALSTTITPSSTTLPPGFIIPTLPAHLTQQAQANVPVTSLEDNLHISSHEQRSQIMSKLSNSSRQSPVLLLTNLVGINEVDADLEGEVMEECARYGHVLKCKIYTDQQAQQVRIYVVFSSSAECLKAVDGLNGRYFAQRLVSAQPYSQVKFESGIYAPS